MEKGTRVRVVKDQGGRSEYGTMLAAAELVGRDCLVSYPYTAKKISSICHSFRGFRPTIFARRFFADPAWCGFDYVVQVLGGPAVEDTGLDEKNRQ